MDVLASRNVLAFRVRDDAFLAAGLRAGDRLLIEPRPTIADGRTVLARISGEATLRRYWRAARKTFWLAALTGDASLSESVDSGEVEVVGVLIGVVRRRGFSSVRHAAPVSSGAACRARPAQLQLSMKTVPDRRAGLGGVVRQPEQCSRLRVLEQTLECVTETYASTVNPKLRKALLAETRALRHAIDHERGREPAAGAVASTFPAHFPPSFD
jgi:hypothetical protein